VANNLLASMSHFAEIFETLLTQCAPKNIVEVGCEYAGSTRVLAAYAAKHGATLHVIDPSPKTDPDVALADFAGSYRFIRRPSVDVLPTLTGDIFFVDGDHNYWTVHSELTAIYCANPNAWVVLHDVGFPWARRDLYYAPDQIPTQHRHTYSFDHGLDFQNGELRYQSGFWSAGDFAIATEAGTPHNGVLTAIEDFLSTHPELHYASIPLIFGLGVIVPTAYADFVDDTLRPYQGPLCETLERNRLNLYNDLLILRDRHRKTLIRRWANRLMDAFHL
jgi:hypothetical protein